MTIDERLKNLNKIEWGNVPDEDLRLAYYMLKEHPVFQEITVEVVHEMSVRMQSGGFCIYPKNIKPVARNVPDFMYKWPFRLLWKQNRRGERNDDYQDEV